MFVKWPSTFSTTRICNIKHIQPAKVEKIDKAFFSKIVKKWLSLGASVTSPRSNVSNFGFNHLFLQIRPICMIWSKKNHGSFNTAIMAPQQKMYLLTKFFSGPEIFRKCSWQYYLPFLRVSEKTILKYFEVSKNAQESKIRLRHLKSFIED